MNFLQIAQRVHLLLRIGEERPGTQPTTVVGQVGVLAEMVSWVSASVTDICNLHPEWLFLRGSGTVPLASGASSITLATLQANLTGYVRLVPFVDSNRAYILIKAAGNNTEVEVEYCPHEEWYGHHDVEPLPANAMPSVFTIAPNGDLLFNSESDQAYTVRTSYRRTQGALAADADETIIPDECDMLVVWWAIVRYYCVSRDGTMELRNKAQVELNRELTSARNKYLPGLTLG